MKTEDLRIETAEFLKEFVRIGDSEIQLSVKIIPESSHPLTARCSDTQFCLYFSENSIPTAMDLMHLCSAAMSVAAVSEYGEKERTEQEEETLRYTCLAMYLLLHRKVGLNDGVDAEQVREQRAMLLSQLKGNLSLWSRYIRLRDRWSMLAESPAFRDGIVPNGMTD